MQDNRLEDRLEMVETQIKPRGRFSEAMLQAMQTVPRHFFVPAESQREAYEDSPLSIGCGQTISQPFIVASMIELIEPKPSYRVLEVGLGSGYSAAVLSRLVDQVYSIEREGSFIPEALRRFEELGYTNIEAKEGDGSLGWPEKAPFDAILVTAAAPQIPPALLKQLKEGGVVLVPVGNRFEQDLVRVIKQPGGRFQEKSLYAVRFVPLVGKEGWPNASR